MSLANTFRHKVPRSPYLFQTYRLYSTTNDVIQRLGPRRALVYNQTGNPSDVLYSTTNTQPVEIRDNEAVVRFLLAPINPADLNVIEGVYPTKPTLTKAFGHAKDVFIAGNEGAAQVVKAPKVTSGEMKLDEGDWVVMRKPQSGTWSNWKVVDARDVIKLPKKQKDSRVTDVFAATVMVNMHTALGLLRDVSPVEPGDWILQNGANSGVGQALIQVAKRHSIKSINFIRNRPDVESLKDQLRTMGADHVFTYEELLDKGFKKMFKELGVKEVRHAYNGIGGETATAMAALLSPDGHLISYGGMSKQPLKIPVGLQIFKNLTCHGYWHSTVWDKLPHAEQQKRLKHLTEWREEEKLLDPLHEVVVLKGSDEDVTRTIRDTLERLQVGKVGKKLLLKWDI